MSNVAHHESIWPIISVVRQNGRRARATSTKWSPHRVVSQKWLTYDEAASGQAIEKTLIRALKQNTHDLN